MNDQEVEAEVQKLGLTAPRLTLEQVLGTISSEEYHVLQDTITICVLILRNGYKLVGKSMCVSAENFDVGLGKTIAKDDAVNQIWQLEGYMLKERLHYRQTLEEDLGGT